MEGRKQLPAEEVTSGRKIASLRIHVERVIGSIKKFSIPMARIANQIVSVCVWLTNFQPALIPIPSEDDDSNSVEEYFESLYSNDYDADTELSDLD